MVVIETYTAQVEVTTVFYLVLNPMTSNTETLSDTGPFNTRQEAIEFYESQRVEPYREEGPDMFSFGSNTKMYTKYFRKGSVLEWMNPTDLEALQNGPNVFNQGIHSVVSKTHILQRLS